MNLPVNLTAPLQKDSEWFFKERSSGSWLQCSDMHV